MGDESGVSGRKRRGRRIPATRSAKRRGELAELAFVYKAASLGFGVAKPYGDSYRYDFILDWDERLWRVQVKSTSKLCSGAYHVSAKPPFQRPNDGLCIFGD